MVNTPPRVAQTHLDAGGKAAIRALWAEHAAQRQLWRLQQQWAAQMRAVISGARRPALPSPLWVDPVVRQGERA